MANQRGETTSIGHFYNRCVDAVNNLFDTMSFWTHSKDVEFVDGKTAETKVGAINGITSDMSGEADDIAASIKCVNQLNSSLGGLSFGVDADGNYGYYKDGADSVTPFKSGIKLKKTCNQSQLTIDEDYDECLLVFASAGSYGSLAITNGGNYTMEEAGKSMVANVSGINGQSNTGCYIIKNLQKGAIISATKNNSSVTIWNYGFWLFA